MFNRKEYMKDYNQTKKYKDYQRKYEQTKKCKEQRRKHHQTSETYKEYQRKYKQTKKYKDYREKYQKEYRQTEKYKEYQKKYQKKYQQTERGRFVKSQQHAMQRNLGFVLITDDIPDEPYEFHHINHNLVAAIPSDLHTVYDRNLTAHRFYCYQIIKQLYKNN